MALTLTILLTASACDLTSVSKNPPDPTVEYLPCTGMGLDRSEAIDPALILGGDPADVEGGHLVYGQNWGGEWRVGSEWHVALVDVGLVDWETVCPQIMNPDLVVHEVPHSLNDLQGWQRALSEKEAADTTSGLGIDAGQYVIQVLAPDLEKAFDFTEGIPLDAWKYGGTVSGNG
ncbi:MAG: hypothetical protein WA726_00410 [Acidimicrobiia bacterium]